MDILARRLVDRRFADIIVLVNLLADLLFYGSTDLAFVAQVVSAIVVIASSVKHFTTESIAEINVRKKIYTLNEKNQSFRIEKKKKLCFGCLRNDGSRHIFTDVFHCRVNSNNYSFLAFELFGEIDILQRLFVQFFTYCVSVKTISELVFGIVVAEPSRRL